MSNIDVIKQENKTKMDYDTPWKLMLETYFEDFILLFLPEKHAEIDWNKGYRSLDKELLKITKDAIIKNKQIDKLVQVYLKNGQEAWVLFHLEIQGKQELAFEERMFIYRTRLHDLYRKPVISIALLIDQNKHWRPRGYKMEFWDCSIEMKFLTIKLLDFKDRVPELKQSRNRFAPVILAQLAILERNSPETRLVTKIELTKHLYSLKWSKRDVINLYIFIDWIMKLPEPLNLEYHKEMQRYEGEVNMAYITTAERIGFKRGIEQGLEQGREEADKVTLIRQLTRKFGDSSHYIAKINNAHSGQIRSWLDKILEAESISDLFAE